MVTVHQAKHLIRDNACTLTPVERPLAKSLGYVLATDILAPMDIPSYPQSGMDGYAFKYADWQPGQGIEIIGEIAAGMPVNNTVGQGKAVRIFTGAPVPAGTDTVVMQEKTSRKNEWLYIDFSAIKKGDNVRLPGTEIKKNELALAKNTPLTPAALGFLAGMGISSVTVYPTPSIALLITGNELQQPGQPLAYGQVYESNGISLQAALQKSGLQVNEIIRVQDKLDALTSALMQALEQHDLVLITGGISVGDYDFTLAATKACDVEQLFHKVSQKPGKPLFAGKKEKKLVLALPGNPASVLTCYYEYVTEAISKMMLKNIVPENKQVPLQQPYWKKPGLAFFLKAYFDGTSVHLLASQESYKLNSFARANCLVFLPEETEAVDTGTPVEIHLIS